MKEYAKGIRNYSSLQYSILAGTELEATLELLRSLSLASFLRLELFFEFFIVLCSRMLPDLITTFRFWCVRHHSAAVEQDIGLGLASSSTAAS